MQSTSYGHYFNLFSCSTSCSVFKDDPNPLPVVDRSRDRCYQDRCSLQGGRPEFRTLIAFLYHTDSRVSDICRSSDPSSHSMCKKTGFRFMSHSKINLYHRTEFIIQLTILIPRSGVPLGNGTGGQLDKKFLVFYETKGSLSYSEETTTGTCPEPHESSPHRHTLVP
jgi:hypothetical protein